MPFLLNIYSLKGSNPLPDDDEPNDQRLELLCGIEIGNIPLPSRLNSMKRDDELDDRPDLSY